MRDILADIYPDSVEVDYEALHEKILRRVFILNEHVWEKKLSERKIEDWLDNFTGRTGDAKVERVHALYILSQFMYFGSKEIRVLLKALYRDLFYCPLISEVKRNNGNIRDSAILSQW